MFVILSTPWLNSLCSSLLDTYRVFREPPSLSLLKISWMLTLLCSDSPTHQKRMNGGLTLNDGTGRIGFEGYKIVNGKQCSIALYINHIYIWYTEPAYSKYLPVFQLIRYKRSQPLMQPCDVFLGAVFRYLFRIYKGNKKGILVHETFLCTR